MTELIAVPLDGGGVIVVEASPPVGGVVKTRQPGKIIDETTQSLEVALESVGPAAKSILAKLREAGPAEITVEFGLALTAEVGAVITKTSGECNITVQLRWARTDVPPA
ncbi:MAG: hypothetical protein LC799_19545 [Actinobacteria bacterium]|nr:hypothetical protein [Actinomycetota bacterium]MCA1706956.1 hypothetical protein [Actinomycetota bacterium]